MEEFFPYEKLSKKEKRKLDSAKRTTWGEFSPVTRKPENSKAYNRRKAQNWRKELPNSVPYILEIKHLLFVASWYDIMMKNRYLANEATVI